MNSSAVNGSRDDSADRLRALDTAQSFIVQAPAGSGKTELLIQRYLKLLGQVGAPEQVLAITFTRKAAGEMRDRVMQSLGTASDPAPNEPHRKLTWRLAREVLRQDKAQGWQLQDRPARLAIMTIDSFNSQLARRMAIPAEFPASAGISDRPEQLYRQAAERVLSGLGDAHNTRPMVEALLMHLDNSIAIAQELLADMLARRDHWLRHVVEAGSSKDRRDFLEQCIARAVEETLRSMHERLGGELGTELAALARDAADLAPQATGRLGACRELRGFPAPLASELPCWQALASLCLTGSGTLRKRLTAAEGFPPGDPVAKSRMSEILETMREMEGVEQGWAAVRDLPAARYSDEQWRVLEALLVLLKLAAAELEVLFGEREQTDYAAVSLAAIRALGQVDDPTDLALYLDYRIQHVLVDEFQDTSHGQYSLLRILTAGWQAGDGRTLFCVGDPMQSIYRFREAEVGYYLDARRQGIGSISLQPLSLTSNFRSQANIVEWVNGVFAQVFPATEDQTLGAIAYSASRPVREAAPGPAVQLHGFLGRDDLAESAKVVEIVAEATSHPGNGSVAVLVRSRPHLTQIARSLRSAGIQYKAVEIEKLGGRPVVLDLLALTRALVHPADRTAWLSVLHAPFLGLDEADLLHIAKAAQGTTVPEALFARRLSALSDDGQRRLQRCVPLLDRALASRGNVSLRQYVESVWLALGGPAGAEQAGDLEDAESFLRLIEGIETGGDLDDVNVLSEILDSHYAAGQAESSARVQVMTIHKAKGLEFDTVILPGLGKVSGRQEKRLLRWQEIVRHEGLNDLLLAPLAPQGQSQDPLYAFLSRLEQERDGLELRRLLYVAATRARERLHLLGHANASKDGPAKPQQGSLLAALWESVAGSFVGLQAASSPDPPGSESGRALTRSVADWTLPTAPQLAFAPVEPDIAALGYTAPLEFDWAGETARATGTIVHQWLQRIAEQGTDLWSVGRITSRRPEIEAALRSRGLPESRLSDATQRTIDALHSTIQDPRGRWLLGSQHPAAWSELALTGALQGRLVSVVMDRVILDSQGVLWIVDYKTGHHEGAGREEFLLREQERYRDQMVRYAAIAKLWRGNTPVRTALYFPLMSAWCELH